MFKKTLSILALAVIYPITSYAANSSSDSSSLSSSDSGAIAQTGSIVFEASDPKGHTSVSTTAPVYVPPSAFGFSQNNCGSADTMGVSVTGFGFGGSRVSESASCNTRQDTATAWNLGMQDVAKMRFFCFGEDANRMAFEASGHRCPDSATAKGIADNRPVIRQDWESLYSPG